MRKTLSVRVVKVSAGVEGAERTVIKESPATLMVLKGEARAVKSNVAAD